MCHKVPEFHYLCGELQEFEDTVLKGVLSSPLQSSFVKLIFNIKFSFDTLFLEMKKMQHSVTLTVTFETDNEIQSQSVKTY